MGFREVAIITTYKCNSQCIMCNIWKRTKMPELEKEVFNRLPPDLRLIGLNGGEPFLRDDLVDLFRIIRRRCRYARISINTNGLQPHLIKDKLQDILREDRDVQIILSLDGIGRIHDQIRGIEGAYEKVMETIQILRVMGIKNLAINFTILDKNIDQIEEVYNLSKKLNISKINFNLAHNSDFYYHTHSNSPPKELDKLKVQLNKIIKDQLVSFDIRKWFKAFFLSQMISYIKYGYRSLPCCAGKQSIFIDCNGDIYPCHIFNRRIGNLRDFDFNKDKINGLKYTYIECPSPCWLDCSIYPLLREKPYLALEWITLLKLKSLFNKDIL